MIHSRIADYGGQPCGTPVERGVIWQVAVADSGAGNIPRAQGSLGGWESLGVVVGLRVVGGQRVGQVSLQYKEYVQPDEHHGR